MAAPFRIVFEEDGYPRELVGPEDWARAVSQGALTPDMEITLYRQGESPSVRKAAAVDELRALFRLAELPDVPDRSAGGAPPAGRANDHLTGEASAASGSEPQTTGGLAATQPEPIRIRATVSPLPREPYGDSTSLGKVTIATRAIGFAAKGDRSFGTAFGARRYLDSIIGGAGLHSGETRAPRPAVRTNLAITPAAETSPSNLPTRPAAARRRPRTSRSEDKGKKVHWAWLVLLIIVLYVLVSCSAASVRPESVRSLLASSPALAELGHPRPATSALAVRATREERSG